jgi:hypothetical protein
MNSRGFLYSMEKDYVSAYTKKIGKAKFSSKFLPKARIDYRRMVAECSTIVLLTIAGTILAHGKR